MIPKNIAKMGTFSSHVACIFFGTTLVLSNRLCDAVYALAFKAKLFSTFWYRWLFLLCNDRAVSRARVFRINMPTYFM